MAVSGQFAACSLLIASLSLLYFPTALSQGCGSGELTANYAYCEELPTLGATIHWTYKAAATPNPTLSFAFTAAPAGPNGWVAWGLNPTAAGMVGTQALLAFRASNGSFVVNTYNITAYGPITESLILYGVSNRRAKSSGGLTTISATLTLPAPVATINQVWQVGADVLNGVPQRHAFAQSNLRSVSTLALEGAATPVGSPSFSPSGAPSQSGSFPPRPVNSPSTGGAGVLGSAMWVSGVLISLGFCLF